MSWRLNEDSDSSGSRRAGGNRFRGSGAIDSEAALAGRCPGPGYHESPRHRRTWLTTTGCSCSRRTQVDKVARRYVVQTLPHQHRRLEGHSFTHWQPMKCREDRRDVVVTTSARNQTSHRVLYRLTIHWLRRIVKNVKPRLHDTTCCETGCTTQFDNRLNEQPLFVQQC